MFSICKFAAHHFCTEEMDTTTSDGHLSFGIKGVLASNERIRFRERTTAGRLRKVEMGIQAFRSQLPWGYIVVRKDDIIRGLFPPEDAGKYFFNEEQVYWVQEAFRRYAAGESLRSISRFLFENGVRTNRGSDVFAPTTLKRIFENRIYIGEAAAYKVKTMRDESRIKQGLGEVYFVDQDEKD